MTPLFFMELGFTKFTKIYKIKAYLTHIQGNTLMSEAIDLKAEFQQAEFDKAINLVSKWDFTLTKKKLLEPEYAGWSKSRVEKAEQDYKKYLAVTQALGGYQLVPNGDIDRFWHEHILDTRRYAQDCTELFSGFLHHYPFFGMQGESDNENWVNTANESTGFWEFLFSEKLYEVGATDAQKCPQACPNGINSIQRIPQKCPQACPNGVSNLESIDKDNQYLSKTLKKKAA